MTAMIVVFQASVAIAARAAIADRVQKLRLRRVSLAKNLCDHKQRITVESRRQQDWPARRIRVAVRNTRHAPKGCPNSVAFLD